ncbi:LysE family translocator [Vibrio sp. RC27]
MGFVSLFCWFNLPAIKQLLLGNSMIDQATLITYLAVLLGFVFIPGPAVLLTLAKATSSGSRAGIATGLGIALGDLVHTFMAVVGISAVIMTSALLFNIVKFIGVAYLVYLGVREIFSKSEGSLVRTTSKTTSKQAFKQAVILEVFNPKSAMFFLAFLPQFVNPANGSVSSQVFILGVLFILMGLLSTITVSISAGKVSAYLKSKPTILKWQNKVIGSIYCSLGLRLALQDRT